MRVLLIGESAVLSRQETIALRYSAVGCFVRLPPEKGGRNVFAFWPFVDIGFVRCWVCHFAAGPCAK
jgi:hypothetical protein